MYSRTLGEFEEMVLLTVAAQHDQAYGVSIKEALEEHLGKSMNISAIHVTLKRMLEKGLVKSRFGGITQERGGRRKKFYMITKAVKLALDRQYELRSEMYQKIPKITFG